MDEYESMINDESVKCALTKEQFKEVKALRALREYSLFKHFKTEDPDFEVDRKDIDNLSISMLPLLR